MFPNSYSVYLHDTPSRDLFEAPTRAFSSGCIRVQHPLELAERLLSDPKRSAAAIEKVVKSGTTTTVQLRRPLPVLLLYWTAFPMAGHEVAFAPDIYKRDGRVLDALRGPVRPSAIGPCRPPRPGVGSTATGSQVLSRVSDGFHSTRRFQMPEYMLLVRNQADHQTSWPQERHLAFIKQCEAYIGELKRDGKLIAAQPLIKEGRRISGTPGEWQEAPLDARELIQVGYYHIVANDDDEAAAIARRNPEFEFSTTAQVEVRMVKGSEAQTGFVYPR
jgi:hypothetical protein